MTVLRPATPADQRFLLALTERLASFPLPGWRTADEIARADHTILLDALLRPSPASRIIVADDPEGDPAGYVFLTTRTDYFTGRDHAHVEVLAVRPESAGRGIGRALMGAAEAWARDRGFAQITLNVFHQNTAARAVYDRLGYHPETIHYRKSLDG